MRVLFFSPFDTGNVGMAASGAHKCPKSEKLDEAQALAKSCAGRPDFLPCDGLSYAPRTVTGSASSCTGAVTWAGVTVSL